jgi:hypothetical protein
MARPHSQQRRPSLVGSQTLRRETQLFTSSTQTTTQTLSSEEQSQLEREQQLQHRFSTIPEEETDDEGDENQNPDPVVFSEFFDDADVAKLDRCSATELTRKAQGAPEDFYRMLGTLMNGLRDAYKDRDVLIEANEINKSKAENLQDRYEQAAHALQNNVTAPGELARAKDQIKEEKKKTAEWYSIVKQKEAEIKDKEGELALLRDDLAQTVDLQDEITTLKAKIDALENDKRGRSKPRSQPRSDASRSLSRRRRAQQGQGSRSVSRPRSRPDRTRREGTYLPNMSTHTVVCDPAQLKNILTDRNISGPSKFTGKSEDFYPWIKGLELKLRTSTFKSQLDGLQFVQTFLSGDAYSLTEPRIPSTWGRPCMNPYETVDEMLEHLKDRYGETNTEARYMTKMENLVQNRSESFSAFYSKFQQYRAYLPDMSEKTEMFQLTKKLNTTYKTRIRDGTEFASLKELVRRLQNIENQLEEDKDDYGQANREGKNRGKGLPSKDGALDEQKKYKLEDIPEKYRKLKALDDTEREKCRKEGRCLRCREKGHLQYQRKECPLGKFTDRTITSLTTTTSGTTVADAEETGKA